MKCSGSYAAHAVLLSVVLIGISAGQVATGTPALGSFAGGPDIVNLGNLNTHLDIPIARKAGRGTNFNYDLTYDSSIWKKVTVSGTPTWQPVNTAAVAGWSGLIPAGVAYIGTTVTSRGGQCGYMGQSSWTEWNWTNFYYSDQFGTSHPMGASGAYIQGDGSYGCPPAGPEPTTVPWSSTASDGSGYSMYINPGAGYLNGYIVDVHGTTINVPVISDPSNYWGSTSTTDRNGNQITSSNGSYTDTLNTTALTVIGTAPSNTNISYTAPSGSPATYVVSYASYTEHTNFGCSGIAEYPATSTSLVDRVTLPDGTYYQFSYETTPGDTHNPHYVDGRIASVTLPTGGTISYTYTNGNLTGSVVSNGIVCADGSTAGLTRTVTPGGNSPAGTWTYARTQVGGAHWQTTTTDPTTAQNQTVIDFWEDSGTYNFYATQILAYQGSSVQGGGGTLLSTTITCYNNANPTPSNCPTTAVTTPISNQTAFRYLPDSSGLQAKTFISYYQGIAGSPAEIDSYNYGVGSVGSLAHKVVTSYGTFGAGAILPTSVAVEDSSNTVAAITTFTYDEGSVTSSGATQHVSISGGRGNVTTLATKVNSTQTLYKKFDYYDTGMLKDAYDYTLSAQTYGPKTSYVYDNSGTPPKACDYAFPTTVNLPITGLSRSMSWNCTGGVQTSVTDENGQGASVGYTDTSFWRPASATDPLSYVTSITYSGATVATRSLPFNGTNSVVELRAQIDGLGRPLLSQSRQGPGSTNYNTVETDRDSIGRAARLTLPFAAVAGATSSTAPGSHVSSYDGLGRPISVGDSGGGSVTYSYYQNDVLQTVGPAPVGENAKTKQLEHDALGRLTSVCEVTDATGSGNCGQNSARTGYWTKYTYDLLGDLTAVTQNAQAAANSQQTRGYTYDMVGRILTEINPETGTTTYVYDTDAACGTTPYPGNLVKRVDANGNATCYVYDNLQRMLSISYLPGGPNTANTPAKTFVYGTARTTTINGVTLNNTADRMVEAYTSSSSCTSKCTDLLLSYSARGEIADVYESTPNSGAGYYHVNSQYWANGALNTLSLLNASGTALIPAITYGADGAGRTSSVTAATGMNPVFSTSYNTGGQVTGVSYMSATSDNDSFTYDSNTFRLTDYQFNVGSPVNQNWGHLNWNQDGTLGSLAITDQLNTSNSQTCNYTYDDLGRLASKNPATPNIVCGTKWSQTVTLDAFGNISKVATVGTSFQASYIPASGPPTNRIVQLGSLVPTYDANGNLTYDATTSTTHQYTWDAEGKMLTIDNGISSGVCLTYDALGRMVEQGRGSSCTTRTQIVYAPGGFKLALMSGQALQKAFVPLTGGATAVYNTSGLQYFRHTDWLGSSRLASTSGRALYYDTAYAPFGEDYKGKVGTGGALDLNLTGQNQDTVLWMYDFVFREYSATQGRWMSPDPAGTTAVTLSNPQSWNRYAYGLNDPCGTIDPLGLCTVYVSVGIGPGANVTDQEWAGMMNTLSGIYHAAGVDLVINGGMTVDATIFVVGAGYSPLNGVDFGDWMKGTSVGWVNFDATTGDGVVNNPNRVGMGLGRVAAHELAHFLSLGDSKSVGPMYSPMSPNSLYGSGWTFTGPDPSTLQAGCEKIRQANPLVPDGGGGGGPGGMPGDNLPSGPPSTGLWGTPPGTGDGSGGFPGGGGGGFPGMCFMVNCI
jgi:RHS repeat-associated protein